MDYRDNLVKVEYDPKKNQASCLHVGGSLTLAGVAATARDFPYHFYISLDGDRRSERYRAKERGTLAPGRSKNGPKTYANSVIDWVSTVFIDVLPEMPGAPIRIAHVADGVGCTRLRQVLQDMRLVLLQILSPGPP